MQTRISRRTMIRGVGLFAAALPLLSACGASAPPATPAPPSEPTKPASAPASAATVAPTKAPESAAKPTTAPNATPTPAQSAAPAPAGGGKFQVWFSANWNEVTDKAVGDRFAEWGKTAGIQVEWQSIPGAPAYLAKQSASVAAGQPPEVDNANNVYWYTQGEMLDVTSIVKKVTGQGGGMFDIATTSTKGADGKHFGVPYAIDGWALQWRKDIIEPLTGGGSFKTWDDVLAMGEKAQKPPKTYTWAMALGKEGDHVNNICTVLWCYGGAIADKDGVPDIKNPNNRAGIETMVKLWKAKLIPPDTWSATVTSWNNETYQKSRGMMIINPTTVWGWLVVNDKELADKTGIAAPPAGSAGSFAEGSAVTWGIFKKGKLVDRAPEAIEYFLQPEGYKPVIDAVQGRYVHVYKSQTESDFWRNSAFKEMVKIAENGRIRTWPGPAVPWLSDITDARYTLSNMMSKIINENLPIEQAQEWAQSDMMDAYNKLMKK